MQGAISNANTLDGKIVSRILFNMGYRKGEKSVLFDKAVNYSNYIASEVK
jgi:hypothetical protein